MIKKFIYGSVCATLVMLCVSCGSLANRPRTIKVQGYYSMELDGDAAVISIGVREEGKNNMEAQNIGNAKINKIISVAKNYGVSAEKIKTTSFRISPIYDYSSEKGRMYKGQEYYHFLSIEMKNYKVTNNTNVLGEFIDSLYEIDNVEIDNVSYKLSDNSKFTSEARANAVKDAMNKCAEYAEGAGVKLGKVLSITENYSTQNSYKRATASGKVEDLDSGSGSFDAFTNLNSGKVSINSSVTLEVEIR